MRRPGEKVYISDFFSKSSQVAEGDATLHLSHESSEEELEVHTPGSPVLAAPVSQNVSG